MFAIGYECVFAYAVAFLVNQIGGAVSGQVNVIGLAVSGLVCVCFLWLLFRPYQEATTFGETVSRTGGGKRLQHGRA